MVFIFCYSLWRYVIINYLVLSRMTNYYYTLLASHSCTFSNSMQHISIISLYQLLK
jgi:hypothetical protein